jgi:hypothetical protein
MPREPANPFGLQWSPIAPLIWSAGLPGGGMLWPFGPWDPHWWSVAANDE